MKMSKYLLGQAIDIVETPIIKRLKPVCVIRDVNEDYSVCGEIEFNNKNYASQRRNSCTIYFEDGKIREVWSGISVESMDKVEKLYINVDAKPRELSEKFKKELEQLEKDINNSGITGFNRDYDIACGGGEHLNLAFEDAFIVPVMKYDKNGDEVLVGFTVHKRKEVKANFYGFGIISLKQLEEITKSKESKITLSDERPPSGAGGSSRDHFWHGVYKKQKIASKDNGSYPGEGLAG